MKLSKKESRAKRKVRIRKKISGTQARPRLVVFRSNRHIYAQLINDVQSVTLAAYSSQQMEGENRLTQDTARSVGKAIGEKAKSINVDTVVFDRNGYYYHGRIKALAEGARETGLNF